MGRSFWLAPLSSTSTSVLSTTFSVLTLSMRQRRRIGEDGNDILLPSSVMFLEDLKISRNAIAFVRGRRRQSVVNVMCAREFSNKPIPGCSSNWSSSPAGIPPTESFLSCNERSCSSTGFVLLGRIVFWLLRINCGESGRVVHVLGM